MQMKSIVLLSAILICSTFHNSLYAQDIDSLKNVATNSGVDSQKIDALNKLAWAYKADWPDSAIAFATQAEVIARQIADTERLASAYMRLGVAYKYRGDYHLSLKHYVQSLELRKQLGNAKEIARAYNSIGTVHTRIGNFEEAIANLEKAKNMRDSIGDSNGMLKSLINLANCHAAMGDYSIALPNFREVLIARKNAPEPDSLLLASAQYNLGSCFYESGRLDSAIQYLKASLKTRHNRAPAHVTADNYNSIAAVFLDSDLPSIALQYQDTCLAMLNLQPEYHEYDIGALYGNTGVTYEQLGQLDSALAFSRRSLNISEKMQSKTDIRDDYSNIQRIYFKMGNTDSAYAYQQRYLQMNDSIMNEEKQNRIVEMQTFYDDVAKERKLTRYEQQKAIDEKDKKILKNRLRLIMVGAVTFVLISSLTILLLNHKRKSQVRLAAKQSEIDRQKMLELMKDQEITSINAMMDGQEKERKRIAQDLHDRLGGLLATVKLHFSAVEEKVDQLKEDNRETYNKANSLLDEACQEVRSIAHNMATGTLAKFGLVPALSEMCRAVESSGQLKAGVNTFGVEKRLDSNLELVLYRIIQELVSNVIRHANAKEVNIQLTRHNGHLNIIVEDDGVGFNTNVGLKSDGMGLKGIQSRVEKLGGKMEIDSTVGNGTSVVVEISV